METETQNDYCDGYSYANFKLYPSRVEAFVSLPLSSGQTLYQQLADSFAESIHQGTLKAG
jgi:hypothetical protein